MAELEGRQYPTEVDKLRQLAEFLPVGDPFLYMFSTLLSERLSTRREISPFDFVYGATTLLADLERGPDGFTRKPIESKLVGLPKGIYDLLTVLIPTIARAVYPEDFANQVDLILQEFEERKQQKRGQP